jgi:TonB-linked SusC/RagA family outer membrane protein
MQSSLSPGRSPSHRARNTRFATALLSSALALFLALGAVPPAYAQGAGTIRGTVVAAGTRQPLAGAQVQVLGTQLRAVTNSTGAYQIANVPAGRAEVRAQMIGHTTGSRNVTVAAGETATANFELTSSAITLDELVVTGAGVATEKRRLGNTVASIDASALENRPIATFSEALQGREPGVVGLPSGGLTGEGTRIRIRGTNSLSQSNEPIVYLNGVRIDNGGGRGNLWTGGGGMPSRLDDIDPASIERVEILKGAAAATLYGTEASGGVIQIFTKTGKTGETRWNLEVEQGVLNYPDVYKPNAGLVTSAAEAQRLSEFWGMSIQPFQVFERNFIGGLLERGHSSTYTGSVSGGTSALTYFASGRYQAEDGPVGGEEFEGATDKATRAQGTVNLTVFPAENLQLRLSSMYTQANSSTLNNNNNIYAPVTLAMFGQPHRAGCSTAGGSSNPIPGTGRCEGIGNPLGVAAFATVREAFQRRYGQEVEHYNGSVSANYRPLEKTTLDATFGVDIVNQRDAFHQQFGWNLDRFTRNNVDGARIISDRNARNFSLDTKLSRDDEFGEVSSQFVLGAQGFIRQMEISGGSGVAFPGPGFEVADAGAIQDVDEFFEANVNAGLFAQEQVGFRDWIFGTVGARYDYNSAFGESAGGALYPKASLSLIPSDMPGWNSSMISTLRFRGAWGQSGLQPSAFAKFTTFSAVRSDFGAGIQPSNLGSPDLEPEVSTEWEGGAELGLFQDRLALEATYWDRTVNQALVARQFPVSGGFLNTQLDNIGRLESRGVEIGAKGVAYQGANLSVNLFANAAWMKELVAELGDAPPLKVGGSYPRYRNWIREGYAPGAFFGPKSLQGVEYPLDLDGDCRPDSKEALLKYFGTPRAPSQFQNRTLVQGGGGAQFGGPIGACGGNDYLGHYLGKPTPDWQGGFGGNVTLFRDFEIATLFEYKAGNYYVHNLTDAFRRAHGALGGNLRGPKEAEAILRNPASTPEQRLEAAREWSTRWLALTPYDGLNEIEEADFIRWRELSLTYNVPGSMAQRFGARSLALTATGRNIALWTKYSGIDPEVNVYGRGTAGGVGTLGENFGTGIDAFGFPLPRRFTFSARVGF